MMQISVKADVQQARAELRFFRQQVTQAAARALNRTAQEVQSAAVKEIAAETGLKQKDVREALKRTRANAQALIATVEATGRAVNLIRFTNQTRSAARKSGGVRANAWGTMRIYRGTFIGNQGRTVFVRVGKGRLPIRAVHGPSIPREMAREKVSKQLILVIEGRWPINFESDLRFYLRA